MRFEVLDADGLDAALRAERRPFVLDVRPPAEFEAGHVPGAHNVPVHDLGRRQSELPSSKVTRVLVIGEPGRRSQAAATWLVLMGYGDVALVGDGMAAWRGAIETGPPKPPDRWRPELRVLP